jgi:hypothetical protein
MDEARSRDARDRARDAQPGAAQPFDPVAWERRVREARARRAEALARRGKGEAGEVKSATTQPGAAADAERPDRPLEEGGRPSVLAEFPRVLDRGDGPRRARGAAAAGHALVPIRAGMASELGDPAVGLAASRGDDTPSGPPKAASVPEAGAEDHSAKAARSIAPASGAEFRAGRGSPDHPVPAPVRRDLMVPKAVPPKPPEVSAVGSTGEAGAGVEAPSTAPVIARAVARHEAAAGGAVRALAVPQSPDARPSASWSRSRIAAVFVAGIAIGLGGAFVISDRLGTVNLADVRSTGTGTGEGEAGDASPGAEAGSGGTDAVAVATEFNPPPAETVLAALPGDWEPAAATTHRLAVPLASARSEDGPADDVLASLPAPSADEIPALPSPFEGPTETNAQAPAFDGPGSSAPTPDTPASAESEPRPEGPSALAPPPQADERPTARPDAPTIPSRSIAAGEIIDEAGVAAGEVATDEADSGESDWQPASGAPARVLVHVPSGVASSESERTMAALGTAGYTPVGTVSVPMTIGTTNIRYYHPEDAAAAQAMAAAITDGTGTEAIARDFTDFRPQPAAGTIEIWLAGQPRTTTAQSPSQQASPPPPAPAAASQRPPSQPSAAAQRQQPTGQARQEQRRTTPQEAAMRELENLADEIARAIARSLGN